MRIVLALLTLTAFAHAQQPKIPSSQPAKAVEYTFTPEDVTGGVVNPNDGLTTARVRALPQSLIKVRSNFHTALLQSAEQL